MVGSMGPAVSGVGRGSKVAAIHLTALVAGALGTALVLTLLGAVLRAAKLGWLPVALVGIAVLLGVLQVAGVPAVQSRWQVPEQWRRLMDVDALAAFYGLLLGVGGLTMPAMCPPLLRTKRTGPEIKWLAAYAERHGTM